MQLTYVCSLSDSNTCMSLPSAFQPSNRGSPDKLLQGMLNLIRIACQKREAEREEERKEQRRRERGKQSKGRKEGREKGSKQQVHDSFLTPKIKNLQIPTFRMWDRACPQQPPTPPLSFYLGPWAQGPGALFI